MKKVLSLVLALVMCLGMTTIAFAADPASINEYDIDWVSRSSRNLVNIWIYTGPVNAGGVPTSTASANWTQANTRISKLNVSDFDDDVWTNATATDSSRRTSLATASGAVRLFILVQGKATEAGQTLAFSSGTTYWYFMTENQKEDWDIGVKLSKTSASFTGLDIRFAQNTSGYAQVGFKTATELNSTGSKSSEDTLQVTADGTRISKGDVKIRSDIENKKINVLESDIENPDETEVQADAFNTRVQEFKGYVSKGVVYVEKDTIFKGRFYAKKYLFQVTDRPDATAEALMDKFNFDLYKKTTQVGMSDSNTITFDVDDSFYVYTKATGNNYDAVADSVQLVYLGKSDDDLAFSGANVTEYFFSTKELDIDVAPTDEPSVEPSEIPGASTSQGNPDGGPTGSAPNANYNPGTGR